jgi:hypothetical protein
VAALTTHPSGSADIQYINLGCVTRQISIQHGETPIERTCHAASIPTSSPIELVEIIFMKSSSAAEWLVFESH